MQTLSRLGRYIAIDGRHQIKLFGLYGRVQRSWAGLGPLIWFLDKTAGMIHDRQYMTFKSNPDPAIEDVLEVLDTWRFEDKLGRVARLVMSNRLAVRLFLDGTIGPNDFAWHEETVMGTSTFLNRWTTPDITNRPAHFVARLDPSDGIHPVINLRQVDFAQDGYGFPVSILDEWDVGNIPLIGLDQEGRPI